MSKLILKSEVNLHDEVYVLKKDIEYIQCDVCKAEGCLHSKYRIGSYTCPVCNGHQMLKINIENKYIIKSGKIIGINASLMLDEDNNSELETYLTVEYTDGSISSECYELDKLFINLVDAEKECERLNSL